MLLVEDTSTISSSTSDIFAAAGGATMRMLDEEKNNDKEELRLSLFGPSQRKLELDIRSKIEDSSTPTVVSSLLGHSFPPSGPRVTYDHHLQRLRAASAASQFSY
jgi:hypothetical protein